MAEPINCTIPSELIEIGLTAMRQLDFVCEITAQVEDEIKDEDGEFVRSVFSVRCESERNFKVSIILSDNEATFFFDNERFLDGFRRGRTKLLLKLRDAVVETYEMKINR